MRLAQISSVSGHSSNISLEALPPTFSRVQRPRAMRRRASGNAHDSCADTGFSRETVPCAKMRSREGCGGARNGHRGQLMRKGSIARLLTEGVRWLGMPPLPVVEFPNLAARVGRAGHCSCCSSSLSRTSRSCVAHLLDGCTATRRFCCRDTPRDKRATMAARNGNSPKSDAKSTRRKAWAKIRRRLLGLPPRPPRKSA